MCENELHVVYYALTNAFDGSLIFERCCDMMSDHILVLSDQNGDLVGQMSFQGKKTICSLVTCDGLACHPEGAALLLVASRYGNRS